MTLQQENQIKNKFSSQCVIKNPIDGYCGYIRIPNHFPIHFFEQGIPLYQNETDETIKIFNLDEVLLHLDWFVEMIQNPIFMGFWTYGFDVQGSNTIMPFEYPSFINLYY